MKTIKNKTEQNCLEEQKYIRAKKRVENLKGYYWHLAIYLIVNTFISVRKIIKNLGADKTFEQVFLDWNTFSLWFFWGLGLAFHTFKIFGFHLLFGKDWEERKIKEFMKEEQKK